MKATGIIMRNESNWYNGFRKAISQVNEESGFGEQDGVSWFFNIFARLNPKKLLALGYGFFKGSILPTSGRGTWIINRTRGLLFNLIPFVGIAAALVSATIEYKIFTKLYDSTPMELSEITYKLPEKIVLGGLHVFGILDIRKQSGGEQQDSEKQNTSEKKKSWLPLMTAFVFETTKCFLIFYRSAAGDSGLFGFKKFMTIFTSALLIVVSFLFTLIFFAALMNQQELEEASKERKTEIEDKYRKLKEEIEASKQEEITAFEVNIKNLETLHKEALKNKEGGAAYTSDIEQIQTNLGNEKTKLEEYRKSVKGQLIQLIKDEEKEIEASKERKTEIEDKYRKLKEEIEASKQEEITAFEVNIKNLETLHKEALKNKEGGAAYTSDIEQIQTNLGNEKTKLEEYRKSVKGQLIQLIKNEKKEIGNVEKEIAKSSKADPEWMRKILDIVHKIFGGKTTDDYPRVWAHLCIIMISLSVTAALESIIWCVFAVIGQESST